MVDQDPLN